MSQFLPKLLYLTKGHHKSLIAILFLFFFISGLELFGTGMIGPFIAVATNPELIESNAWLNSAYQYSRLNSKDQFLLLLGAIVVIAFYLKAFFAFNAQLTIFRFSHGLKGELSNKLMKAYLNAPYSFHLRTNSASLIHDITATTDSVCIGFAISLLTSINNSLITLALVFLLIKTNAMALLLILLLLIVLVGLYRLTRNRLDRWGKDGWQAANRMIHMLNHGIGGFKETRIIGCEPYFIERMQEQTKKYAVNTTLAQGYGNLPRFVVEAVMISFLVGFTFIFINLNRGEEKSLTAVLGIFTLASVRLLPAIGNLVSGINIARSNAFAVDKLFFDFKELEEENLVPEFDSTHRLDSTQRPAGLLSVQSKPSISLQDEIVLDRVSFEYPNVRRKALDKISLTIRKGQSIGLIGKSGAGKTTLVDVLLGLFTPQTGDIRVDGISIYSNLRAWQNLLGYVPQSIFLIDDTLERNIAFGVPDHLIDQNRLKRAIEMAQLSEVVKQLPDGVKTIVGERGVLLSGGQRQRVGIARVLYHEREILVFDEATAALDTETEKLVTEATKSLSGTKTIIIIAHRLSTIMHCDQIYQLEQGRIVKSGSYQEVVHEER
jgi:ABC-type multidrug transport system fused ATPase/permease subunit